MIEYKNLVSRVLHCGEHKTDRTGVGTLSVFGERSVYNLADGFPLMTHKKMDIKSIASELMWFLEGSTDERRLAELRYGMERQYLVDKNTIWTANADEQGVKLGYENNTFYKQLGPVYGRQWRDWNGVDQIRNVLDSLRTNPNSRRHIVSAWNVSEIDRMALPPCHTMFQFYVDRDVLSCQLYQRSADAGLGIPYNVASYAMLVDIFAAILGMKPGKLVHVMGDVHIYDNHTEALIEAIHRTTYDLPKLVIKQEFIDQTLDVIYNDGYYNLDAVNLIGVENYMHGPALKLEMAV